MMLAPRKRWELSNLIGQEIARQSTPTDHGRLQVLLLESPEARRYYYRVIALHSELFWGSGKKTIDECFEYEPGLSKPTGQRAPASAIRLSPFVLAIAVSLLLVGYFVTAAVYVAFRQPTSPLVAELDESPRHATEKVSAVVLAGDADTPEAMGSLPPVGPVRAGKSLSIESGIVELRLTRGVRLSVEGPADWTINGSNSATLKRGKIVANVPKPAIGFALETPTAKIVDLGTEFGVEVDERGQTRTQVFKGEVRMNAAPGVAATGQPIGLTAGQAVRVGVDGQVTHIAPLAATREQFIPSIAHSESSPYDTFDPNPLSPFAKYVIEQTKPAAYWDFSHFQNPIKIVCDRMRSKAFDHFSPAQVGAPGPTAEQGFAGFGGTNPAIEQKFASSQRQGLLFRQPEVSASSFSAALWVQLARTDRLQFYYYILGTGRQANSPREGVRDSVMIVGTANPAAAGKLAYFDGKEHASATVHPTGKTTLKPDEWYWVTFVRQADRAAVYLNGSLEIEVAAEPQSKVSKLFSFGHRIDLDPMLMLQGRLDEAALWDRPLSPEEVAAIFGAAVGAPAKQ